MLPLSFGRATNQPITILCIGAHSDDIEIGAGGAILSLLDQRPGSRVVWVVCSATAQRADEARRGADIFLKGAGSADVRLHNFRDGFFPAEFAPLKEAMESLKSISPDLVFTHHRHDGHQDHRTVAELTWNTFRNHLILEYEIPKYDPDLTNPNAFFPLTESEADRKVASLMTCFESQRDRRWFVPETFMALMRIRGMQAASPTGLAEGFHAPKFWILTDTLRHSNAWA